MDNTDKTIISIFIGIITLALTFFLVSQNTASLSTSLQSEYHCNSYPLNNTCANFIEAGFIPYPLPNIPNVSRAVNNTNQYIEVPEGQFNQSITWSLGYACLYDGNSKFETLYNNILVTKYTFNATTSFVTIHCVGYGNPNDILYNWTVEQFYET